MTMQVGMVGTDGILIASDTRWMNTPRLRMNELSAGGRYTFNSPKIVISHEHGIAISRAKNMETSGHVANEIISSLNEEDWQYPIGAIEAIGARVLRSAEEERNDVQCLIAFARPAPQLFLFQFGTINGQWGPICHRMETTAMVGDTVNPALFWVERYYQKLPIEKLVPLAAHLVVSASKLNGGSISGLEIVLCDASGIRRLSDESIRELEAEATRWDIHIGDLFLSHRQQFTYAPNMVG